MKYHLIAIRMPDHLRYGGYATVNNVIENLLHQSSIVCIQNVIGQDPRHGHFNWELKEATNILDKPKEWVNVLIFLAGLIYLIQEMISNYFSWALICENCYVCHYASEAKFEKFAD